MKYWLLKTEPEEWSWNDQVKNGTKGAEWNGVRNFQASKNLKNMKIGDRCFFYHTGKIKSIVGIAEVIKEALSWRSPPTTRGGRQGRLYYGTQVASRPPSFTMFVNDPKLFGDTYRRYVERHLREGLGFDGTPVKLFWRGKQQRDAERDFAKHESRS